MKYDIIISNMNPQDYNSNWPQNQPPADLSNPANQPNSLPQAQVQPQFQAAQPAQPVQAPAQPVMNAAPVQPAQPNYPPAQMVQPPVQVPSQYAVPEDTNPYTVEYLNSIAPQQKVNFWTKGKLALVAFIGLALILSIWLIAVSGGRDTSANADALRVFYGLSDTNSLAKKYQGRLKNAELSALNASFSTSTTSDVKDLEAVILDHKMIIPDEKTQADSQPYKEATKIYEDLDAVLSDAYLNTTLDSVYAREMSYRLSIIKMATSELSGRMKSDSATKALDKIIANLETVIKGFDEINTTN